MARAAEYPTKASMQSVSYEQDILKLYLQRIQHQQSLNKQATMTIDRF